jgi:hypothetical protein
MTAADALAHRLAEAYAALPGVVAVVRAGSRENDVADEASDLDLYVYAESEPPLAARATVAAGARGAVELGNRFFEPGDEWIDAASGLAVDVMFRAPQWIEAQLDRVLVRHEASIGYSTAFWHNVLRSTALVDPTGFYAGLQARAAAPYPEPLRRAIVARNHPLLRRNRSSFAAQLARAVARGDRVAQNHRTAAFLASLFDVIFALNRLPHPGEKRLVAIAQARCRLLPPDLARHVEGLFAPDPLPAVQALCDGVDRLLDAEGYDGDR